MSNNIERYLNEEMSINEQEVFEKKIKHDAELSEKVELQRDIMEYIQSGKMKLGKQLDVLGGQYFIEKKTATSFNRIWLVLSAFVLIGALIWLLQGKENKSTDKPAESVEKNTTVTPPSTLPKDESTSVEPNEASSSVEPNEVKKTEEKTQTVKEKQPIASINKADYKPNPLLENLLKETVRAGAVTNIEIVPKSKIVKKNKTIPLKISGNTTARTPYQIIIYSNKISDFERDYHLFDQPVLGTEKEGVYYFNYKANLSLKKGLYYLILKQQTSSEVLYISKFSVE